MSISGMGGDLTDRKKALPPRAKAGPQTAVKSTTNKMSTVNATPQPFKNGVYFGIGGEMTSDPKPKGKPTT